MATPPRLDLVPSAISAGEIAAAAHASDLFVFRRVQEGRFAHVGGTGRGAGWAGIVQVGVAEEPMLAALLEGAIVRVSNADPEHVLGPYYVEHAALVPVSGDLFVVFGSSSAAITDVPDTDLRELARFASDALVEVEPAKRLADELELLNAVRDLLHAPTDSYDDGLRRLVEHATAALSCDLGVVYIHEGERVFVSDVRQRPRRPVEEEELRTAVAELAARESYPLCIQRAEDDELPVPFRSEDGVLSYYLLEVARPLPGILLLLHTRAAGPRGFTDLCQMLGQRLIEAAEPLLDAGFRRDTLRAELERAEERARLDPLTKLANRLAWSEALSATNASPETPISVVQLDCRGLKAINETHGHVVGDDLLVRAAEILKACVREEDLVARLGGDEFAILLRESDEALADRIVARIEAALEAAEAHEPRLELAIGCATTRDDELEETQARADALMLEAKRRAGDRRVS
jgi:diguanylate cyclase (GGDEF)-like protein